MYILGISSYYHDSAACLLKDGEIIAAVQEERFTRKKNDASFPINAINYCLSYAKIDLGEIAYITYYEKPFVKFERLLDTYLANAPFGYQFFIKSAPSWIKEKLFLKSVLKKAFKEIEGDFNGEMLFTDHHQSHAASAFFASPFESALLLMADGVGEWSTTSLGFGESNQFTLSHEMQFPHSIGLLYSTFTAFLGYRVNLDEYKVMGLAAYGTPKYADLITENLLDLKADGSFRFDMSYLAYLKKMVMFSPKLEKLLGEKARKPDGGITQFHMDVAASVQLVCENILLRITNHLCSLYPNEKRLVMAGGVALNCVANGRILRETPIEAIWIQPAAGDAGGALGAALATHYQYLGNEREVKDAMQGGYLGPSYSESDIESALKTAGLSFERLDEVSLLAKVGTAVYKESKVVGWFQGKLEFGPRALGNRSILGDPRNPEMKFTINRKIKDRETYRPFAPAMLPSELDRYFDLNHPSPYMLLVDDIKATHRISGEDSKELKGFDRLKAVNSSLPSVTHVNHSARLQTVDGEWNPRFHKLLQLGLAQYDCGVIINTSFNMKDEPIVCRPEEAIKVFQSTKMDALVIGDFWVEKSC